MSSPVPNNELTRFQTGEEQVETARKGGIASGESRRKKRTFTNAIKWLANADCEFKTGKIKETFIANGIDITGLDTTQLATLGLWAGAVYGNAQNYKTLMEGNGESDIEDTGTPIVEINVVDNSNLEKILYEENRHNKNA